MANSAPYPAHDSLNWDAPLKTYIDSGDADAASELPPGGTDGQVLTWDADTSSWVPAAPASGGSAGDADIATAINTEGSATDTALDGKYVDKKVTGGGHGVNPTKTNSIGPNAATYTVFGGTDVFPHAIGNSTLSNFAGYDNKNWDNSIAAHNHGHHSITGGGAGHGTISGGSMGVCVGGYGFVGSGTDVRVYGIYGVVPGGSKNTAGANVVATLTQDIVAGATTITVDNTTGVVVGQTAYVGAGTPSLATAYGDGPLERGRVASISGSTITLDTFVNVQGQQADGSSSSSSSSSSSLEHGYLHIHLG